MAPQRSNLQGEHRPKRILACFAVKEEAKYLRHPAMDTLITGIGPHNAERTVRQRLQQSSFDLVLTCGFAGGLNPSLSTGTVIFSADDDTDLTPTLRKAGAHPITFHCASRVAITVEEKQSLRESTGADAVEMESGVIRAICRAEKIPSATIRVISDNALESLPLDFNALMTAQNQLNYLKLVATLLTSPGKIPSMLHLQRQTQLAAKNLAAVLDQIHRSD